jgi:hypothetical protein
MSPLCFVQPNASLAERLRAFVWRVVAPLGERVNRAPEGRVEKHLVPVAVYRRILAWMQARREAIEALMARIGAGTLRKSAGYAPRRAKEGAAAKPRKVMPAEERFPRLFGWVCRWAPEAHLGARDLRDLLDDPEMKALVLAAPGRMVRLWSPLLHALGQTKPAWFPTPPKRARKSRAGQTRPEQSRMRTPPPPSRLEPPPPYVAPSPVFPPPRPALPPAAPWLGRGPGPCASLAQYRSPFQPGGDDHPPAAPVPDEMREWERRRMLNLRRNW